MRLIPYLSMLVVSVVDRDLGLNLDNHTLNAGPGGISFDWILHRTWWYSYLPLHKVSTQAANKQLKEVETVSQHFTTKHAQMLLSCDECKNCARFDDVRTKDRRHITVGNYMAQPAHVGQTTNHRIRLSWDSPMLNLNCNYLVLPI